MRRRPLPICVTFALMLSVVLPVASPAHANKLCPPISVAAGETCECTAFNYATSPDSNIQIKMYQGSDGVVRTCGGGVILGQSRGICIHTFDRGDTCGCQVTGEGGSVRVSIAAVRTSWAELHGDGTSAKAAIQCTK